MTASWPQPTGFENDPLADVQPGACRCDGTGWVQVRPEYAERVATRSDGTRDEQRYQSALLTVYPCKVHRPAQFFRWLEGHYGPDHDPHDCEPCREALHIKSKRHHP